MHLLALVGFAFAGSTLGQAAEKAYTEGTVWDLTFVRTKYAMADDYLESLQSSYKKEMDAAKKEGLVVSYKILSAPPANQEDWDIVLMVEYKNMAAMDGIEEKMEAVAAKAVGDDDTQKKLVTQRAGIRKILGSKLCRELVLK